MAASSPKKKKITRKNPAYPRVEISLPDIFEENIILPESDSIPNGVALALRSGDMPNLLKFLRDNGFEQAADAWDELRGKDENEAFMTAWSKASSIDLPKSEG